MAAKEQAQAEGYDQDGRNGDKKITSPTHGGKVYLVGPNIASELEAEKLRLRYQ